ncbi:MAG: biotin/lipoyl-binding protein, partial [Lachnospiraceae bacterium]|nr:biotin/lipoyl-binding protein [Lachnospiraceae bacterium]
MKQSRKDWIKNITIIFLAIMLVLTFFSNTIMNYSLPEVATDMVEPGTVTTKIRGTGTLEADDPYKVTIQESRVIASVAVKEGDVVEKDQVLFYLEDKESAELEAAEKKLDEMVLAYTTSLLAGEVSQQSYENIRSGNISSTGAYQSRINEAKLKVESAQAAVDSAQATVDSLSKQIAIAGVGSNDLTDKETALKNAEAAKSKSYENLTKMQAQLAPLEEKNQAKETAQKTLNEATNKTSAIKTEIDQKASDLYNELGISGENFIAKMDEDSEAYEDELTKKIQDKYPTDPSNPDNQDKQDKATKVLKTLVDKYNAYNTAKDDQKTAQETYNNTPGVDAKELEEARVDQENAQNHYDECAALVESLTNEINNNTANTTKQKADLEKAKIEAEAKVKDATTTLEAAKKELEQLLTDVSKELDLSSQSSAIR